MQTNQHIILFDGACNFCNFWVRFVIKRDKKNRFRFASLHSEVGKELKIKYQLGNEIDSVVLIKNNKFYLKSNAVLEIAKNLGSLWFLLNMLKIIPLFVRDKVYDFIAKHRLKWFGKQTCDVIPNQEIKHKFL